MKSAVQSCFSLRISLKHSLSPYFVIHKKSQITFFMIIVVLGLAVFLAYNFLPHRDSSKPVVDEVDAINLFVQGCIESVGTKALTLLGYQGGSLYPATFPGWLQRGRYNITYNYFLGANLLPPREEIAAFQIDTYMVEHLNDCLADFSSFKVPVYTNVLTVNTNIHDDYVEMDVDYPIMVGKSTETRISRWNQRFNVRLGLVLDVVNLFNEFLVENPHWVDLTLIDEIEENQGIQVTVLTSDKTQNIFYLIDTRSNLRNMPYKFWTANYFGDNLPPDLLFIGDQTISAGSVLSVPISADDDEGDAVTITLSDPRFVIAKNKLFFKPPVKGNYTVVVTASDNKGNSVSQPVVVTVV